MSQNTTSSPSDRLGWVSAGDQRSTLNILWSCLSIFILCTWSCLHLNVPSVEESEAGWEKWTIKYIGIGIPYWPSRPLLRKWGRQGAWMVAVIIAPEFGVAMAMHDYATAKAAMRQLKIQNTPELSELVVKEPEVENIALDYKAIGSLILGIGAARNEIKQEKENLTLSHAFFANMGAFKVRICQRHVTFQNSGAPASLPRKGLESQEQFSASIDCEGKNGANNHFQELIWEGLLFNFEGLRILHEIATNIQIPSEQDIKVFGKNDALRKIIACVQSGWLLVQCIGKAAAGLAITQLELAAMGFVLCGILMYLLWWSKPFGIERRVLIVITTDKSFNEYGYKIKDSKVVKDNDGLWLVQLALPDRPFDECLGRDLRTNNPSFDQLIDLTLVDGTNITALAHSIWSAIYTKFLQQGVMDPPPDPPDATLLAILSFYASGTLFCAFHILAWNFEFPSPTVRSAWRVFAVAATSAGPLLVFVLILQNSLFRIDFTNSILRSWDAIFKGLAWACVFSYCVSRLGLVILIFFCFSSMPRSAYQKLEWTQFLPHFS